LKNKIKKISFIL